MFRLWYLAFMGKPRGSGAPLYESPDALHESPWSMRGPLVILALLSIGGGWIGIERAGGWLNMERFTGFLAPVIGAKSAEGGSARLELVLSAVAVGAALLGWLVAYLFYREESTVPARLAGALPQLQTAGQQILRGRDLRSDGGQAAAWRFEILSGRA
jgi:NADH-quinone oxidoreductase subunit L